MKELTAKQEALPVSAQNEPPKSGKVMLMVSGEITLVEDRNLTFIILTSDAKKKYILVGPKAEELSRVSGKKVTVVGIPSKPIPQEIKGEPVRMTIEVKTAEIKQ